MVASCITTVLMYLNIDESATQNLQITCPVQIPWISDDFLILLVKCYPSFIYLFFFWIWKPPELHFFYMVPDECCDWENLGQTSRKFNQHGISLHSLLSACLNRAVHGAETWSALDYVSSCSLTLLYDIRKLSVFMTVYIHKRGTVLFTKYVIMFLFILSFVSMLKFLCK